MFVTHHGGKMGTGDWEMGEWGMGGKGMGKAWRGGV